MYVSSGVFEFDICMVTWRFRGANVKFTPLAVSIQQGDELVR